MINQMSIHQLNRFNTLPIFFLCIFCVFLIIFCTSVSHFILSLSLLLLLCRFIYPGFVVSIVGLNRPFIILSTRFNQTELTLALVCVSFSHYFTLSLCPL